MSITHLNIGQVEVILTPSKFSWVDLFLLWNNRSSNINYYYLELAEVHSHEPKNKTSTRDNDLMWFNQLYAYVHGQRQKKKSNINDMDYNNIDQTSQRSQLTQTTSTNLISTQTKPLINTISQSQYPITLNNSLTLT